MRLAVSLPSSLFHVNTGALLAQCPNSSLDAWCTAEMCTGIIVVSLPSLKSLIIQPTPKNTVDRSTNGYLQNGSAKLSNTRGTNRSHIYGGEMDEEMELTYLDRRPSPSPTITTVETGAGTQDAKDSVMVRTDVTVTREGIEAIPWTGGHV
jgi:hypothetical protein